MVDLDGQERDDVVANRGKINFASALAQRPRAVQPAQVRLDRVAGDPESGAEFADLGAGIGNQGQQQAHVECFQGAHAGHSKVRM